MQRYTIFFIAVGALHVSGGFSALHQELKLYTQHLVTLAVAASKLDIYQMLFVHSELLMTGGKTA